MLSSVRLSLLLERSKLYKEKLIDYLPDWFGNQQKKQKLVSERGKRVDYRIFCNFFEKIQKICQICGRVKICGKFAIRPKFAAAKNTGDRLKEWLETESVSNG